MSVEQVIESGVINYDTTIFSLKCLILWVFVIIFGVVYLIGCYIFYTSPIPITASALLLLFILVINFAEDYTEELRLKQNWKDTVAYPYIQSLPEQKSEIIYIKIDPELSHNVQGNMFYIHSTEVQRVPLTISYKTENSLKILTDWYATEMSLSDSDKSYMTYKQLDVDLGNGVNAGMYDKKIYLPENYKFTDIK